MATKECRVQKGGLFHSHKVQYSKETQSLLNRLLEESKLSILQRRSLKESVRRGQPLPTLNSRSQSCGQSKVRRDDILVPSALPRRRSYQAIVHSGAYEREPFHPPYNCNMKDREVEKQKLQSMMTYGKDIPPDQLDSKTNYRMRYKAEEDKDSNDKLFDHLVQEIKERLEFLEEMEALGEGGAYKTVIEQEVAVKLRTMANIDQQKCLNIGITLAKTTNEKTRKDPKPLKRSVTFESNIFPHEQNT